MVDNQLLKAALHYRNKFNYSIIPSSPDTKKPLVAWKSFQERKATEEEIREWWAKWPTANISIVTGAISGIVVIDIDTAEGQEAVNSYIPDSLVMPSVQTPRAGRHLYFQHNGQNTITKAGILPGVDIRGDSGLIVAPPSCRSNGCYSWLPGLRIGDIELPPLPESFYKIVSGQNRTKTTTSGHSADTSGQAMFVNGRRDDDLFHVSHCLVKGGMPDYEISQVIHNLAKQCGFSEDEASIKVRSALDRADKKERNLQADVREFVDVSTGSFDLHSIYINLNLKERKEKKNVSDALSRLCKDGIIERVGNKNGCYRKVDKTIEYIDFLNADDSEFEIAMPLGLNSYVKIQPKNIIVIAGSPNSGKTAFLLNVLHANLAKHQINYCSSEMGANEWKDRLSKFDEPKDFWGNWKPQDRSDNFADAIIPEAVNIIDFLELTEDFYLVGRHMRDIYNKLTTGIAIVALQKAPGATMGRGGVGSLEKPRLYLTMEGNKIQIVKGKNWRHSYQNPNGMEREFSLFGGCKFTPKAEWTLAEDKPAWKRGIQ